MFCILIVTFGWSVWKVLMAFWKYVRPGPGVAFVQKVSVTWPLEDEPLPLPLPLLLPPPAQAEAVRATPRPSAAIAAVRVLFIIVRNSSGELAQKPGADRRMPARFWRRDSRVTDHKLQFRRSITVSGIRTRSSAVRPGLSRQVRGWGAVVALTQTPLSGPTVA